MKRAIVVALLTLAGIGLMATPASAAAINGCDVTGYWTARPDGNDLTFRANYQGSSAFMTPPLRSGGCRHVYVENFGMWNGLDGVLRCIQGKVVTYNEDGTIRVDGSWVTFNNLLEVRDLRPTIDRRRLYRAFVRACEPSWRTADRHIGIRIWAQ